MANKHQQANIASASGDPRRLLGRLSGRVSGQAWQSGMSIPAPRPRNLPPSHLPNRECSTYTTLVWEPAGAPGTPDRSGGLGRNGPGSRKNNSGTQTEEKPQNGKRPRHQLVSHREDACCVCSRGNERRLQLHCPMHVIDRQDRKKNHCGPIKDGEKKNSRFFIPLCVLCGILEHWQNTSEITYPRTGSWTRHIDSARSERKKKIRGIDESERCATQNFELNRWGSSLLFPSRPGPSVFARAGHSRDFGRLPAVWCHEELLLPYNSTIAKHAPRVTLFFPFPSQPSAPILSPSRAETNPIAGRAKHSDPRVDAQVRIVG